MKLLLIPGAILAGIIAFTVGLIHKTTTAAVSAADLHTQLHTSSGMPHITKVA